MGKIKGKLVKRAANEMANKGVQFSGSFSENKKILGKSMPSKKIRNQIAGYMARQKKEKKN